MALKLNFDICSSNLCRKITFTDLTGEYHVTDNPTGWESPNPTIADVTSATLEVWLPNATSASFTFDLYANSPSFPTTSLTQEFIILNTDLGYSNKLPDGIYKFVYTVVLNDGTEKTYRQTKTLALTCNAKCCVDRLFADIDDFECDCMQDQINRALTAQAIYKAMISAASCNNLTKFNKLLAMLQRMCNNLSCCS